jgi:hypothetical protein
MKKTSNDNIFSISYDWVQEEAKERIGRKLTCDELHYVKKGIEWGLLTDIDTVFTTAITGAVEICQSN